MTHNTSGAPFDGRRFSNLSGHGGSGGWAALRWMLTRRPGRWPAQVENPPAPKPLDRVADDTIRATLIGHATVLLQLSGLNILTDPIWSICAGPTSWLGVKRVRAPAIAFADLPKIDIVLLSHNHYDHLDRPTLAALAKRDDPLIVTGLKVARSVPSRRTVELDWWDSHRLSPDVRATYVPAEHFSARGAFDRNASLWGGFVLETPAGTIYFAGDTGDGTHFAAIHARFGPMALSFIPIGAYQPRWFMAPVHMNPAEAVAASRTVASAVTLPIHFGVFPLADDGFDDPTIGLTAALAAIEAAGISLDFRLPPFGQPVVIETMPSRSLR